MIDFIVGEVVNLRDSVIIVANNGIGWEINVSNKTLSDFSVIGDTVTVYTYVQVKDDGISFFGFSTVEEREMFLLLLSVNGVGPKMALQVLSSMRAIDVRSAIVSEDSAALTRIKGLGKKTAERIVLELKGKISPMEVLLNSPRGVKALEPGAYTTGDSAEALTVLLSLGMTRNEAQKHISNAVKEGFNTSEEIIRYALKHNK